MCVIAIKPKGVSMPKEDKLKAMWDSNKDGAGFMYLEDKSVIIDKGYMSWDDYSRRVKELGSMKDVPVIMHFRITTHGGTSPQNTHPFPITDNVEYLKAVDVKCNMAMAHNGVIRSIPNEATMSDTQVYIRDILYPLSLLENKDNFLTKYSTLINTTINSSKLVFLDNEGTITKFGDWKESKDKDGLLYSNLNHEWRSNVTYYDGSLATKSSSSSFSTSKLYSVGDFLRLNAHTPKYILDKNNLTLGDVFEVVSLKNYLDEDVKAAYTLNGAVLMSLRDGKMLTDVLNYWYLDVTTEELAISFIDSCACSDVEGHLEVKNPPNNIGGIKGIDTGMILMNADRSLLTKMEFDLLPLLEIPIGTDITVYRVGDGVSGFISDKLTTKTLNWFIDADTELVYYKQKDGNLVIVDEVTFFYDKELNFKVVVFSNVDVYYDSSFLYEDMIMGDMKK